MLIHSTKQPLKVLSLECRWLTILYVWYGYLLWHLKHVSWFIFFVCSWCLQFDWTNNYLIFSRYLFVGQINIYITDISCWYVLFSVIFCSYLSLTKCWRRRYDHTFRISTILYFLNLLLWSQKGIRIKRYFCLFDKILFFLNPKCWKTILTRVRLDTEYAKSWSNLNGM